MISISQLLNKEDTCLGMESIKKATEVTLGKEGDILSPIHNA